jgi:hypothetical protein
MKKVLIASPSPRDIPEFLRAINDIHQDRFFAKYMVEKFAYETIYDVFMSHKEEYGWLVIWPDDLIVWPTQFEQLMADAKTGKYQVIGGCFNQSWQDKEHKLWSVVVEHPNHKWLTEPEIDDYVKQKGGGDPIIKVALDYFGCTFIHRKVLEKIGGFKGVPNTSFDYGFSLDCMKYGIDMYIDTRVRMLHLSSRKGVGQMECSGLGIKSPHWKWVKANQNVI